MNIEKNYNHSILYIEDEIDIRKNYSKYLNRYFDHVYEADNGETAYKIYKDKKPDILIVDINIPKINGLDLLKKIREEDHNVKAIMLTAYSDVTRLLEASELKLTKYLVKPISRQDLKEALDIAIHEISKFQIHSNKIFTLKNDFTWSFNKNELYKNNILISTTSKEKKTLDILFSNINQTLNYNDIVIHVWDDFENDKIHALKTMIKKLRKKLPENTIENVYGIGYRVNI